MVVENPGGVDLLKVGLLLAGFAKHRHPVTHGHGFHLVVGHVQRRGLEPVVEKSQFRPHLDSQLGVKVGEGLVHQEGDRLPHDRSTHRHPLSLSP